VSLKDELQKLTPRATSGTYAKGKCGVNEWLKNQDEGVIVEIIEVLSDKNISGNALYNFLKSKFPDLNFGLTTFKRHRSEWCECPSRTK
jgi:hypothetical protein